MRSRSLTLGLCTALFAGFFLARPNWHVAIAPMTAPGGVLADLDVQGFRALGPIAFAGGLLLAGPLCDLIGGKRTLLLGAALVAAANAALGALVLDTAAAESPTSAEALPRFVTSLFAANMAAQSLGGVGLVKLFASWVPVQRRGILNALAGIPIALALYVGFDLAYAVKDSLGAGWAFLAPASLLLALAVPVAVWGRERPEAKGPGAAARQADADGTQPTLLQAWKATLSRPAFWGFMGLALLLGGFLPHALGGFRLFAKSTNDLLGLKASFAYQNWGLLMMVAAIYGSLLVGFASDLVFRGRRGPAIVVALLGAACFSGLFAVLSPWAAGGLALLVVGSLTIGCDAILGGPVAQDFGGARGVGVAAGLLAFAGKLGGIAQRSLREVLAPAGSAAAEPSAWWGWYFVGVGVLVGSLLLALALWRSRGLEDDAFAGE